ncbi:MAG: formate/nitrite transporter family protein [Eggerthella lenta]
MPKAKCFASAMLAAFIAFGALYFCVFLGDPPCRSRCSARWADFFCLGLVLVLCCGAELFTGSARLRAASVHRLAPLLGNWLLVRLGNFATALSSRSRSSTLRTSPP